MYNKIIILIIGILILISQNGHAQYGNVWAFGYRAGIDFNNGAPVAIETKINTREGSASICDADGQLLFYTDGNSVWDRNHNPMPNGIDLPGVGINITESTTQGTLIVPIPGKLYQYYVFSLGNLLVEVESSPYLGRLYYSIIDMTLNNGLGDVIANSKGVLLDSFLTEHMTAVSGNNCDIWLLVASRLDTTFKAYNIDFNGIDNNPVVSPRIAGGGRFYGILGSIDITPDRSKLAIVQGNLVLYDFDPDVGKIINPVLLDGDFSEYYYGVSFSPDDTKLYASTGSSIYQWDLSSNDTNKITASRVKIGHSWYSAIKRGPDGKIYIANQGRFLLSTINLPNLSGPACQYLPVGFLLLGGTSSELGLPNSATIVINKKLSSSRTDTVYCADRFLLKANDLSGINYLWENGSVGPTRQVDRSGIYWVSYQTAIARCNEHIDTFIVIFDSIKRVYTTSTYQGMCKTDTLLLKADNEYGSNYVWEDGSTISKRKVGRAGIYWVSYQVDSLCEYHTDTFRVTYPEKDDEVSFIADTVVCINDLIRFRNTSSQNFNDFNWTFGDEASSILENPEHAYTQAGVYEARLIGVINDLCRDTLYKTIIVDSPILVPPFRVIPDSICTGQSVTFFHAMTNNTIHNLQWQFGDGATVLSTDPQVQHAYEVSGALPVTLSAEFRACPESSFTDTVYVYAIPKVSLGPDNFLCLHNAPIMLSNQVLNERGHYRYLWSTGETTESIRISGPGVYSLTLTNHHNCSGSETVTIKKDCYIDIPNAFTPNGDGVNDYFFPRQLLSRNVLKFKMQVLNRWGQVVFETTSIEGRGWDGNFNGEEQPNGVYIYWIDMETKGSLPESYRGNVTLIR